MGRGVPRSRSSSHLDQRQLFTGRRIAASSVPSSLVHRPSFRRGCTFRSYFKRRLARPQQLADLIARHPQVAGDLLDRIAIDKVLASNPRNRLDSCFPRKQVAQQANLCGQILDGDPRAQVKKHKFTL
jgi:hypothetical protein